MSVTVRIPTQLRSLSANTSEVQVEASTVAEALKALETAYPGFAERLFDETGGTPPFRERVPRRRGHPLPAGCRLAGHRRSDVQHRARRRRRLTRRFA